MLAIVDDARSALLKKVDLGPSGIIATSPPHLQASPNTSQSSQGATQHIEKLSKIRNSECSLSSLFYSIKLNIEDIQIHVKMLL